MDEMNLVELIKDFADESKCRAYIEKLRWPNGVECPRCESEKVYRIVKRDQLLCSSCEYQFSVTIRDAQDLLDHFFDPRSRDSRNKA